jgi:hypothetical protein
MSKTSFQAYSLFYIYNTNRPANFETENSSLTKIVEKDLFFYSVPNSKKLVFLNSLLFENFLKTIFFFQNFKLTRIKTNANLFKVSCGDYNYFSHFLTVMLELQKYAFLFLFPIIFKDYKVLIMPLFNFLTIQTQLLNIKKEFLVLQVIQIISTYYLVLLDFFINFKREIFSVFFCLLNSKAVNFN